LRLGTTTPALPDAICYSNTTTLTLRNQQRMEGATIMMLRVL
jgi:hypothetical protein